MNECIRSVRERSASFVRGIKHPFLTILALGLVLRFAIMSLAMVYDSNYWALVIRNIDTGNGLYNLDGYFYTPVWGYVLGLVDWFQNAVLDLGDVTTRVGSAVYFENGDHQTTATITSLAFNYLTKLPLVIFDLVMAFLTYVLVKDTTGDGKKSLLAFALVFLSATVIGSTAIIGMPDTIGAMFMMLSIVLLVRGQHLLSGGCFAISALTKFFPLFIIFPIIGYILAKDRDDKQKGLTNLACFIIGVVVLAVVILLPQMLDGTLDECFRFLTDRMGTSSDASLTTRIFGFGRVAAFLVIILISIIVTKHVYNGDAEGLMGRFMKYSLMMASLCMLYPPATQYVVVVIPLLAYYIAVEKPHYMLCWKLLSVGAVIIFLVSLCTHLMPLAVYTDLISVDSLYRFYDLWNSGPGVFTIWNIEFIVGSVIQYAGILMIFVFMFNKELRHILRMDRPKKDPIEGGEA